MSFSPRPCPHCAGTSFHVIPGMQHPVHASIAMHGVVTATKVKEHRWTFTLVACTSCGRSETFTTDAAQLAAVFPGSQTVTTSRTA